MDMNAIAQALMGGMTGFGQGLQGLPGGGGTMHGGWKQLLGRGGPAQSAMSGGMSPTSFGPAQMSMLRQMMGG